MKRKRNTNTKTITQLNIPLISWKQKRALLTETIPMEVDLENRQLFFNSAANDELLVPLNIENLDQAIQSYLAPKDSKKVIHCLSEAEKGKEKPIPFQFIHPLSEKIFHFEFHYKIVYVKYASTRLQGELIHKGLKKQK